MSEVHIAVRAVRVDEELDSRLAEVDILDTSCLAMQSSAPEPALRAGLEGAHTVIGGASEDDFQKLLHGLQAFRLIWIGGEQETFWTELNLVHLPPGQVPGELC